MKPLQTTGDFIQFLKDNQEGSKFEGVAQKILNDAAFPKSDNLSTIMDYMFEKEFERTDFQQVGMAHKAFMMEVYGVEKEDDEAPAEPGTDYRNDPFIKEHILSSKIERRQTDMNGRLLLFKDESGGV